MDHDLKIVEVTSLEQLFKQRDYIHFMMINFNRLRDYMDFFESTREVELLKEFLEQSIIEMVEEYEFLGEQIQSLPASEVLQ